MLQHYFLFTYKYILISAFFFDTLVKSRMFNFHIFVNFPIFLSDIYHYSSVVRKDTLIQSFRIYCNLFCGLMYDLFQRIFCVHLCVLSRWNALFLLGLINLQFCFSLYLLIFCIEVLFIKDVVNCKNCCFFELCYYLLYIFLGSVLCRYVQNYFINEQALLLMYVIFVCNTDLKSILSDTNIATRPDFGYYWHGISFSTL